MLEGGFERGEIRILRRPPGPAGEPAFVRRRRGAEPQRHGEPIRLFSVPPRLRASDLHLAAPPRTGCEDRDPPGHPRFAGGVRARYTPCSAALNSERHEISMSKQALFPALATAAMLLALGCK